ncbi:hypothetical protein BaRGS_00000691, partial [Batillaria attramentaria]
VQENNQGEIMCGTGHLPQNCLHREDRQRALQVELVAHAPRFKGKCHGHHPFCLSPWKTREGSRRNIAPSHLDASDKRAEVTTQCSVFLRKPTCAARRMN